MSRILITGGAGFIGHNTAIMALRQGHEVHILDNLSTGLIENANLVVANGGIFHNADIRDIDALKSCMSGIDAIIHLAAQVSVPASIEDPETNWQINVNGTEQLINSAKEAGVTRIALASSAAVYGLCEDMPLREDSAGDIQSPYAESKMENETQVRQARKDGMEAIAFRFFNVYGPRQNADGAYAAVICKFISMLENRIVPTIYGDGGQTRDFVHVDDVSRILLESMEMNWNWDLELAYNVATQREISLLDLLEMMYAILVERGINVNLLKPEFADERKGDIRHSFASIELAKRDFDWEPRVSLDSGLRALMSRDGE